MGDSVPASNPWDSDSQWLSDRLQLARAEYETELGKSETLSQASGTGLAILAGLALAKWAGNPPQKYTGWHVLSFFALAALYVIFTENRQHRVSLEAYLGKYAKNPTPLTWRANLAASYHDAVGKMRQRRKYTRSIMALSILTLLVLAVAGLL
jgi:hypothetical protein